MFAFSVGIASFVAYSYAAVHEWPLLYALGCLVEAYIAIVYCLTEPGRIRRHRRDRERAARGTSRPTLRPTLSVLINDTDAATEAMRADVARLIEKVKNHRALQKADYEAMRLEMEGQAARLREILSTPDDALPPENALPPEDAPPPEPPRPVRSFRKKN